MGKEKPAETGRKTAGDEGEEGGRKTYETEEGKGKETKDKPADTAAETGTGRVKVPVETGVENERRAFPATITAAPSPFPRR